MTHRMGKSYTNASRSLDTIYSPEDSDTYKASSTSLCRPWFASSGASHSPALPLLDHWANINALSNLSSTLSSWHLSQTAGISSSESEDLLTCSSRGKYELSFVILVDRFFAALLSDGFWAASDVGIWGSEDGKEDPERKKEEVDLRYDDLDLLFLDDEEEEDWADLADCAAAALALIVAWTISK